MSRMVIKGAGGLGVPVSEITLADRGSINRAVELLARANAEIAEARAALALASAAGAIEARRQLQRLIADTERVVAAFKAAWPFAQEALPSRRATTGEGEAREFDR